MFEEVFQKQEDESLEAHCGEQLTLKVCCCCLDYLRQARALQSWLIENFLYTLQLCVDSGGIQKYGRIVWS